MKKTLALLLSIIVLLICLFGCNLINDDYVYYYENESYAVYDINNNELAVLDTYLSPWLYEDKLIYSRLPKTHTTNGGTMDFYCYNISDKTEDYLGTIKDYSLMMSDQSVIYKQHIYIPVTLGDIYDETKRDYVVYDIDLVNKSMSKIVTIPHGFQYNTMTVVNDKILITNLQNDGDNTVEEYDINTKEMKTVISLDKSTNQVNRTITADENGIYTLKVIYEADRSKSELFLDYYDFDYNLLKSVNLADIFDSEKQAQFDETDQGVVSFFISNGYFYYENFSTTMFLGKVENGLIKSVMPNDIEYCYGKNIDKQGDSFLFYQTDGEPTGNLYTGHYIYLFNSESGELKKCEFYADDERYAICSAIISGDNKVLINMKYRSGTHEVLPTKAYYVSINDLNFVDVE